MTFSTVSGCNADDLSPSPTGLSRVRPRFSGVSASKPVSTMKVPDGPTIAHTK